jgi:hypothetical protein
VAAGVVRVDRELAIACREVATNVAVGTAIGAIVAGKAGDDILAAHCICMKRGKGGKGDVRSRF